MNKVKILVVGQIIPYDSGQAIMINHMINHRYENIEFIHIPMMMSNSIDEMGKFKLSKIFHLFQLIFTIYKCKFNESVNILYYPPGGNNKVPFYRDVIILCLSRFLFKKIIFHFHASGISILYNNLNPIFKLLFRLAYNYPDLTIRISKYNPEDGLFIKSKRDVVIHNGLIDHYDTKLEVEKSDNIIKILFVGLICKEKGVEELIDAISTIENFNLRIYIMGKFISIEYEKFIIEKLSKYGLTEKFIFLGSLASENKWPYFHTCDIFCLPSHIETFSLVVLEAMLCKKPIIATKVGGLNELVTNNYNGILIDSKDTLMLKDALENLIHNKEMRIAYGNNSRLRYENEFQLTNFYHNINTEFYKLNDNYE